ncbi:glycosyltransferase family 2 protein [Paeniglutamicibacter antarcticus]|uniref:Glycosyltransferase n=1 Tax=Paeniglutamicibacter antarcticus TaxID=494023 RepID=A0ABP9TIF7_9MICC
MQERGFSVLVIAHGRAGHLRQLLAGAERSAELPCEVVLVYMDEPDPEQVSCSLPLRIHHVSSRPEETGLPLARARNAAAALASCPNLVFLDVDCIASATLFTALVDAIETDPVLAMAQPRYLRAPLETGASINDFALMEASLAHHARKNLAEGGAGSRHEMFWSLGFSIKAELFAQLGGFDEGYTGYGGEDTDFAFRARAAGVPMVFVAEPLFHQHHGVHKPPFNHFEAIVANARLFHGRWGTWPMEGWLGAFASAGLLEWAPAGTGFTVLRTPTGGEIESARSSDPY